MDFFYIQCKTWHKLGNTDENFSCTNKTRHIQGNADGNIRIYKVRKGNTDEDASLWSTTTMRVLQFIFKLQLLSKETLIARGEKNYCWKVVSDDGKLLTEHYVWSRSTHLVITWSILKCSTKCKQLFFISLAIDLGFAQLPCAAGF